MIGFNMPKKHEVVVVNKLYLNPKTVQVDFEFKDEDSFNFLPGQFITLQVGKDPLTFRTYSIASSYKGSKVISIILTVAHDGIGANYVKMLEINDKALIIGPSGRFVLAEPLEEEIIFMVTGTGITPIIAMLYRLLELKPTSQIKLYFGLKTEEDIFYLDLLESCKKELENFDYTLCLDDPSDKWKGFKGRITDVYKIDSVKRSQVYICGNPYMVSDVLKLLDQQGVPREHVYHEKFTMSAGMSTN